MNQTSQNTSEKIAPLDPELDYKIRALACCKFLPGSWDQKFALSMMQKATTYSFKPSDFTKNQIFTIDRLCRKYKRQIEKIEKYFKK